MLEQISNQYRIIKAQMIACETRPEAVIKYHLLADAIYWTDEIPEKLDSFSENCLRFVLRYRTTLLIGEPDEKWKMHWEVAKREFGGWIGFSSTRCCFSEEIKSVYFGLRTKAFKASGLAP